MANAALGGIAIAGAVWACDRAVGGWGYSLTRQGLALGPALVPLVLAVVLARRAPGLRTSRWGSWLGALGLLGWLVVLSWAVYPRLRQRWPLSRDEVEALADVLRRGPMELSVRFDPEAMLDRMDPAGLDLRKRVQAAQALRTTSDHALRAIIEAGGHWSVLEVRLDPTPTLLARQVNNDGEPSYRELVLGRDLAGRVCWVDQRCVGMGFTYSAALSWLVGGPRPRRLFVAAQEAWSGGDAPRALKLIEELARSPRGKLPALLLRVQVTRELGDEAREAALAELMAAANPEVGIELLQVELGFVRGDRDATLAAIDALAARVGPDPFLDVERASVHLQHGELEAARGLARRAVERVPEVCETWWIALECAVAAQDHAGTRAAMQRLVGEFERDVVDVEGAVPAPFFVSQEVEAWRAWRARHEARYARNAWNGPIHRFLDGGTEDE